MNGFGACNWLFIRWNVPKLFHPSTGIFALHFHINQRWVVCVCVRTSGVVSLPLPQHVLHGIWLSLFFFSVCQRPFPSGIERKLMIIQSLFFLSLGDNKKWTMQTYLDSCAVKPKMAYAKNWVDIGWHVRELERFEVFFVIENITEPFRYRYLFNTFRKSINRMSSDH